MSDIFQTKHASSDCSGTDNPADLPSRGIDPDQLHHSELWLHGPDWLRSAHIPRDSDSHEMPKECGDELRKLDTHSFVAAVASTRHIGGLMSCKEYSGLRKLLRVTAYVIRATNLFRFKVGPV